MLAFGSIESNITGILKLWCSPQTFLFIRKMQLGSRLELLRSLMDEQDLSASSRTILLAYLKDVSAYSETRNLIAHSPLVLAFYDLEDPDMPFEEVILAERTKGKHLSFDDLLGMTSLAEALADAMTQNQIAIGMHGRTFYGSSEPYQAALERPSNG